MRRLKSKHLVKAMALLSALLLLTSCRGDGGMDGSSAHTSSDSSMTDRSETMPTESGNTTQPLSSDSQQSGGTSPANTQKNPSSTTKVKNPSSAASTNKPAPGNQSVTVNISDYAGAGDDGDVLNYAIDSVVMMANAAQMQGENTRYVLKLEKKTYRLDSTLLVNAGKNVTIDGNGASLVWTELIPALKVQDCTNVTFQNFNMDYDPLPFTQGVVTSVNGNTVQVAIDEGYRTDITNVLPKGNGYMTIHDRSSGAPLQGTANFYYPENAKHIGGRNISFTMSWQDPVSKKVAKGDVVCLFDRGEQTITLNNCAGTQFIGVNMYSSPGFLFNENPRRGRHAPEKLPDRPGAKAVGRFPKPAAILQRGRLAFRQRKKRPYF